MRITIAPISYDEAEAKVLEFLTQHFLTEEERAQGTTVSIHGWGYDGQEPQQPPFFGVRIAEVSTWTSTGGHTGYGSSLMQGEMPWGIAYCAQVERCIIQLMEGSDDDDGHNFIEEEFDSLQWLIEEDRKEAAKK